MNLNHRWPDYLLPVGMIAFLMVIFMPLPTGVMDLLLAANITIAVVMLLSTVYIKTPLELSVFPSLLLASTMARLALNIGTTRLILTRGAIDHEAAAGGVIQGFSQFVTGDNIAVGLVIFSIIVVVQFVVITKGATRISEVSARFALDGMPGRQLAIDAELNSGVIDNARAQVLRAEVIDHADFYGAMDGASKFVRGDAIAGVIITLINIAGGLAIGLSSGMSFGEAADTFTKLTIGDGLVSQLPALLISIAAGLLVTRGSRRTNLPRESIDQLFARPIVLVLTAIFLSLLVFTELPKTPLILIAGVCFVVAFSMDSKNKRTLTQSATPPSAPAPTNNLEVSLEKLLRNEMMQLELGAGLIRLADSASGGKLLPLVTNVRGEIASEIGVILPKLQIRDNLSLSPTAYQIRVQGNVVARGQLEVQCLLAVDRGNAVGPISKGAVIGMPVEGMLDYPAFWIQPAAHVAVERAGYEILTPEEVLADQLKITALKSASQILTRDATQQLIEEVRKNSPAVVDELIPNAMSLAAVQQILKGLLEEGVSIRPLSLILETLGDHVGITNDHWDLVERVRLRLGRHITSKLIGADPRFVPAFSIDEVLQNRIACAWERQRDEIRINLPRETVERIAFSIEHASAKMLAAGYRPVIFVDQSIRPVIAELAMEVQPRPFVLGSRELSGAELKLLGEISSDEIMRPEAAAA